MGHQDQPYHVTLTGHRGYVGAAVFSSAGTVSLHNPATGGIRATLTGHKGFVRSAVFSPDGRNLATGSDDGTVRLWDTRTGRTRATLTDHNGEVDSVAFSPDGHTLASSSAKEVHLWDVGSPDQAAALREGLPGRRPRPHGRGTIDLPPELIVRPGVPVALRGTGRRPAARHHRLGGVDTGVALSTEVGKFGVGGRAMYDPQWVEWRGGPHPRVQRRLTSGMPTRGGRRGRQ